MLLKYKCGFLIIYQEGEEAQLLDEAIRRNITELVASAFGNHGPSRQPEDLTTSGMEVQEVTVYLNNQQNEGAFGNNQKFDKDFEQPKKSIPTNNDDLNQESISVQNAPNFLPNPNYNKNRKDSSNSNDGKVSTSSNFQVIV